METKTKILSGAAFAIVVAAIVYAVIWFGQNGRYQIVEFNDYDTPTAFVLDTRTGELRAVSGLYWFPIERYKDSADAIEYQ